MDGRIAAIADQLLLIERELRLLGWWQVTAPSAQALASRQPFCVDTLRFAEWLQWVFLPRMKQLIEAGQQLPSVSGILPMAEIAWQAQVVETRALRAALGEFDRLIAER